MSTNAVTLSNPLSTTNEAGLESLNERGSLERHSVSRGWKLGSRIGKTLMVITPVALGIFAISNAPVAEGGPWAACITIAACLPLAEAPPLFTACLAAAGVALTMPTP